MINKNCKNQDFPKYFIIDGTYISDAKTVANKFNAYFVNVGPMLVASVCPPVNRSFKDYLGSPIDYNFHFQKVPPDIISKIIDNLKPKSSSGVDGISNKLLKVIKNEILDILTLIVNQSLQNGIFPDKLKIAKVCPLYKKNENNRFKITGLSLSCPACLKCLKGSCISN